MKSNKKINEKESNKRPKLNNLSRRYFIRNIGVTAASVSLFNIGHSAEPDLAVESTTSVGNQVTADGEKRYYAHKAVLDRYGVIAPWYDAPNGQCDRRIRIAAETLKRYPWSTPQSAVAVYPEYLFTSLWNITPTGEISSPKPTDWSNGDLGQRSTSILIGMTDYYRYSGDPAAIAHVTYMADFIVEHCLTPASHSWPLFPVSVPTKGKSFGKADSNGIIQIDISATMAQGLLRAYQLTGNQRWLRTAQHIGDVLAEKCNMDPDLPPWNRYVDLEPVPWKDHPLSDLQTGGVTMILCFLDELIRLGYTGKDNGIVTARDAGVRYLKEKILPEWWKDENLGLFFWDWLNHNQNSSTTADMASYLMNNKGLFPHWRTDVRNMLALFLNRSSANPQSNSDVFNGAWAYPESSDCCGRSLWYAPFLVGAIQAQYGLEADCEVTRELAYRQLVLQTYDALENGISEDNIDGGVIVNDRWLNIAHPLPLLWVNRAIGWLPEELGPSRENHMVRSNSVVDSIIYGKGKVGYTTFDAPKSSIDVFRLSYIPEQVKADGSNLPLREDLTANGYSVKPLPNGDCIVEIRHDGLKKILIEGPDPQQMVGSSECQYGGKWTRTRKKGSFSDLVRTTEERGASISFGFEGNQVRFIAPSDDYGGRATVFIDDEEQLVPIDFWTPEPRAQQVLYYINGLKPGKHTLKIVAKGEGNHYSKGKAVYVDGIQFSSQDQVFGYPRGTGPSETQRMIFGYAKRDDYKDTYGNLWKMATEIVSRLGKTRDTMDAYWSTEPSETVTGTPDPELYRYGFHAPDFWVNITVAPEHQYDVKLKFAHTDNSDPGYPFEVYINGEIKENKLHILSRAGEKNKAVDILYKKVAPVNGIIQIRFKGLMLPIGRTRGEQGEAFVQALEIGKELQI